MSSPQPPARDSFEEKDFYLSEFRGRTLALAVATADLDSGELDQIRAVLDDLEQNKIGVVILARDSRFLSQLTGSTALPSRGESWVGALWRRLQQTSRAALLCDEEEALPEMARRVALQLRVAKLVWLGRGAVLVDSAGRRVSLVDLAALDEIIASQARSDLETDPGRLILLGEIRKMVSGGLPSISVCEPGALEDELFTYAGSGTFFSRQRYTEVRSLALDEFSAAALLIERGVEEGYLLPRSQDQLETTLTSAFGAFLEGRYLAGIGALLSYPSDRAGEIVSLYTLTRFIGEGVGSYLMSYAVESATARGDDYIFACTTSDRVQEFFRRHGFRSVSPAEVPEEKWKHYDARRRTEVRCLRIDLPTARNQTGFD
jgi:N-acetylglutamate synthase-like GNAT family acetyltransferase